MNITVYLGANAGNEEIFSEAVCELGRWIGKSKNRLIYGGSKTGLMGKLAESVLRSRWHRYAGRNRGDHVKNITAAAGSPLHFL